VHHTKCSTTYFILESISFDTSQATRISVLFVILFVEGDRDVFFVVGEYLFNGLPLGYGDGVLIFSFSVEFRVVVWFEGDGFDGF